MFLKSVLVIWPLALMSSGILFAQGSSTPPAWVTTAIQSGWAEGEWLAVSGPNPTPGYGLTPTNNLVDVKSTPVRGGGVDGIFDEWCGGWGAPNVRTYGMIGVGRGGGHMGYVGNDVFGFDLAIRTWEEVIPDYTGGGSINTTYGEYADGSPLGSHNGSWWFYDEDGKELGMPKSWMSHSLGSDAASVPWGHSISLEAVLSAGYKGNAAATWQRHGEQTPDNSGCKQQAGAAWNPVDGKVYYEGAYSSVSSSGTFGSYDPETDSYTEYAQPWSSIGAAFTGANPAIDPVRNVWALSVFTGYGDNVMVRDLNNPAANRRTNYSANCDESWPAVQINKPADLIGRAGWEWSPTQNGFLYYGSMSGGRDVYLAEYTGPATPIFTPNGSTTYELTWKRLDKGTNGVGPVAMNTPNGNHDRWQVIAWGAAEVAFIMQRENNTVNAFLVSDGSGTATSPAPQKLKASFRIFPNPVKAGSHVTIQGRSSGIGGAKIKIFDVGGRLRAFSTLQPASKEYRWKTAGLANGIYLVRMDVGRITHTRKLLVTD